MKKIIYAFACFVVISSCSSSNHKETNGSNKDLATIMGNYHTGLMQLYPMGATIIGDNSYNDLLPATFTDSYRQKLKEFYTRLQKDIETIDPNKLNEDDKMSYDIFKWEINASAAGLIFHNNYMPFDQFNGVPKLLGIMGSGGGLQPFKTVKDYEKWIQRAAAMTGLIYLIDRDGVRMK